MSPRLEETVMAKKAMRPNRRDGIANPIAAVSTAAIAGGDADPQNELSFVDLQLEIVEIGEIEEQQGRGSKHHDLGPKGTIPDPIHPPVGQRHRCQEQREVPDEDEEDDVRDVVARDSDQG